MLAVDVRSIVREQHVFITVEKRVVERTEQGRVAPRKFTVDPSVERLPQFGVALIVPARIIAAFSQFPDLVGGQSKKKEVLCSPRIADFDVGAIQSANGQRTIHGELHTSRARCLLTSG